MLEGLHEALDHRSSWMCVCVLFDHLLGTASPHGQSGALGVEVMVVVLAGGADRVVEHVDVSGRGSSGLDWGTLFDEVSRIAPIDEVGRSHSLYQLRLRLSTPHDQVRPFVGVGGGSHDDPRMAGAGQSTSVFCAFSGEGGHFLFDLPTGTVV